MTKKHISLIAAALLVIAAIATVYVVLVPSRAADTDIRNIWWNVTEINGEKTTHPERFRVMFDEMGKVGGKSGCNNFGGGYILEGNKFKPTSAFFGTKMACFPDVLMQEEAKFLSAMEKTQRLDVVDENTLKLSGKDNSSLIFVIEPEQIKGE